ncbi:F-box protein [Endozoicomonas ascidiicola]|nr:F-box protein [Endozoicomonas ascidiicola]
MKPSHPADHGDQPLPATYFGQRELTNLPEEMILKVFSYLSHNELSSCKNTCLAFRRIANDPSIAMPAYYKHFNPAEKPCQATPYSERHYETKIQPWLNHFGSRAEEAISHLDAYKFHPAFAARVFYNIAQALSNLNSYHKCITSVTTGLLQSHL